MELNKHSKIRGGYIGMFIAYKMVNMGFIMVYSRMKDSHWTIPEGLPFNQERKFYYHFLTPDGKYPFFVSFKTSIPKLPDKRMNVDELLKKVNGSSNGSSDFYWVSAKVIDELKPDYLK